jgi:hypothetical protein
MTDIGIHPEPRREARQAPQTYNGALAPKLRLDVSIVMPCLNEEEAIKGCIDEARSALAVLGFSGEILVVDNGSTDRSVEVARSAGARVIHEPNRGYGNACRRGLREARGRFVVMGDSDGTYDFSALAQFVLPLLNGAEMVMGDRLNSSMEPGAMPWLHRYVGNPFLTKTMNVLFASDIADSHCGLRSIKKETLGELTLTSPGMEFASEFLIEAIQHGVRVDQVPPAVWWKAEATDLPRRPASSASVAGEGAGQSCRGARPVARGHRERASAGPTRARCQPQWFSAFHHRFRD